VSFDYYLVVPAEKWPTFDQLQAALVVDGLAITVVQSGGVAGSAPFSMDNNEDGFAFVYCQTDARPGGWLTAFTEADFQLLENTWDEEFSHEVVNQFKASEIPIKPGDMLAHISFWDSDLTFGVWNLVCATFVRHFGGHYFDPQSGEMYDESMLLSNGHLFCSASNAVEADSNLTPSPDKSSGFFSRLFGKKD
jgi:hypothetical protein